ncbi:class I SAM-dependent methyltransferase [Microbacteriaceae bacterium VKM Ac-2854]|nr:class I SAM-dependent methyltransferase [Microbacteriaceae bacterium VKM Ac-2854]
MPIGAVTRGTTGTNRLRRVDRWIAEQPVLRRHPHPLVVDLGFGASGVTAFELSRRLTAANPAVEVIGLEIEPGRVARANSQLAQVRRGVTPFPVDLPVSFGHGGFEAPLPGGRRATVIRAFNVLRQYNEDQVPAAWATMLGRLEPDGLLVEGTCDEIGRICTWIDVATSGPRHLTISLRVAELEWPSIAAERLPKALIHHNVPGERVHELITQLDRGWRNNAALAVYGPTQRWIATVRALRDAGWPVAGGPRRWRLGEVSVSWDAVAPTPIL